jgi:hypothetical protein
VTALRWIFALPVALISGLVLGAFAGNFAGGHRDSVSDMVMASSAQCLATPVIILIVLSLALPPSKEKITGIFVIIATGLGMGVCVIPASVVAMLHAGLPATYLNEMGGMFLGGVLIGSLLAIGYILKVKVGFESEPKSGN